MKYDDWPEEVRQAFEHAFKNWPEKQRREFAHALGLATRCGICAECGEDTIVISVRWIWRWPKTERGFASYLPQIEITDVCPECIVFWTKSDQVNTEFVVDGDALFIDMIFVMSDKHDNLPTEPGLNN